MSKKQKVIVIVGPTASGKSDLGVKIAKKINGEVISADSRQVYKGLDIGTGKITKHERRGVPHYLLDVADPRRTFSAARYQKLGKAAIRTILKKGKIPIIVGGTGLYIDSLTYDYPLPSVKPNLKLRKELEKISTEDLFRKLLMKDSVRASGIDRRNRRRLIRALEILQKQPIPEYGSVLRRISPYELVKIGIRKDPSDLKNLIHKRLLKRLHHGLVKEVKKLIEKDGVSHKRLEDLGLEYRYVSRYLRKELTKAEMIQKLDSEIWKYAKRQMTWFKRDKEIRWINLEEEKELLQLIFK